MESQPNSAALAELNATVISAELTLISIIQGTALYFLVNTSIESIVGLNFQHWPYILSGLLIIFTVWSRTLMHIFTMIGWPLEFGHNFFYVAITLLEAVMFSQVANPNRWFILGTGFWILAWSTFLFDMRLIHALKKERAGNPLSVELMRITEKEQLVNIRVLLPLAVAFYVGCVGAISLSPAVFLEQKMHVVLGCVQLAGLIGYLVYSLAFYRKMTPLVVAARRELNGEQPHSAPRAARA